MSGSVLAEAFTANKPRVPIADYMEQMHQAGQVQEGLNANRLFQANTARGQVMAQATDENGIYHPEIANRLAAGRPDAAQAMPSIVGQNQELSGQQLDQAMKRLGWIDSTAGAALTAGDYSDGAMLKMFHNGVAAGVLSLPDVQKQMATMPPDAAGRKAWLEQHQGQAATVQQQLELRYGKLGTVTRPDGSLGGYAQRVQTGAIDAPPQAGAPQGTSPETRAAETPVFKKMPDGTYQQVPEARSARPGASGASNQDKYVGLPNPLLGGLPNPAEAPAGGAAPPASPSLSAPPMGTNEDVAAFKTDQQTVPNIQTGLTNLNTAKEALALTQSGRSTEAVHNFYSFLKSQGIAPAFKDGDVTQYDIARKAMLAFASTTAGGSGTNLGLESQLHSNASMDIDQSAADHVLNQNIGLQRMKLAQVMEAPKGGSGYGQHVTNFGNDNDPRAFAWDKYTPAQRQEIIIEASKTKGGLDKLDHSLEIAAKHRLISIPKAAP
jgi:hypothetical protein